MVDRSSAATSRSCCQPLPRPCASAASCHVLQQHRQQDEGLRNHTERGPRTEYCHLRRTERCVGDVRRSGHRDEDAEGHNGDNIVDDRCEHRECEVPACVEHLRPHCEQSIEHDLWETPPGEGGGERSMFRRVVARCVEGDQLRCEDDGDSCGQEHPRRDDRQQPIRVGRASVGIIRDVSHQLRNEHRIECAARNKDGDDVRQGVAETVRVGGDVEPERSRHRDVTEDPGDA